MTGTPIDTYTEAAVTHGIATQEGESDQANQACDKLIAAFRELRASFPEELEAFARLLLHEDASVQCWTATHLLPHNEASARRVLESLAGGDGIMSFNAEMVLGEWVAGNLEAP